MRIGDLIEDEVRTARTVFQHFLQPDILQRLHLKHQPLMRRVVGNQAAKPRGIGIIDLNAARQIEPRRRIMRGDQSPLDSVRIGERCLNGGSEEHTSELQSLMRISYAVFCLKKKTNINKQVNPPTHKIESTEVT